jgi:hypothetical protein
VARHPSQPVPGQNPPLLPSGGFSFARETGHDGEVEAILAAVQPYEIHGTRYFRFAYARKDNPDVISEGRVAAEGMYRNPQPGDRVDIRMLLGVIDEVKKLETDES